MCHKSVNERRFPRELPQVQWRFANLNTDQVGNFEAFEDMFRKHGVSVLARKKYLLSRYFCIKRRCFYAHVGKKTTWQFVIQEAVARSTPLANMKMEPHLLHATECGIHVTQSWPNQ